MASKRRTRKGRFVVHEHQATHHHFDFRLQIAGALASWAVPKGPSLDPARKRLALRVPDHPLEYIDFEGVIPEGSYGAGPVVLWDRGTFELEEAQDVAAALRAGKLVFLLRGRKLRGGFALTRFAGDRPGRRWLLIKRRDEQAVRGWEPPSALTPRKLRGLARRDPPCDAD